MGNNMPSTRKYYSRRGPNKGRRGRKTSKLKTQLGSKPKMGIKVPMPKTFRFIRTAVSMYTVDTTAGWTNGYNTVHLTQTLKNNIQEYDNFKTLFRSCRVAGARFEITIDRNYAAGANNAAHPNVMMKILSSRLANNSTLIPTTWLDACNIRGASKTCYMTVDIKYPKKTWLNAHVIEGYPHSSGDDKALNVVKRCPYLDMTGNEDQPIDFGHILFQSSSYQNFSQGYEPIIKIMQYTY